MEKMINIFTIITGIIVVFALIIGVIAILVEKKRGKSYTGQGFGR